MPPRPLMHSTVWMDRADRCSLSPVPALFSRTPCTAERTGKPPKLHKLPVSSHTPPFISFPVPLHKANGTGKIFHFYNTRGGKKLQLSAAPRQNAGNRWSGSSSHRFAVHIHLHIHIVFEVRAHRDGAAPQLLRKLARQQVIIRSYWPHASNLHLFRQFIIFRFIFSSIR